MIERVAISDIRIGERRRQDLGDIAGLAKNIETHGLIHPIVISSENDLIAGERRLRAHEHLGWDTIEVRRWAVLDPIEQKEIELAENLNRKDLTEIERSRKEVARVEVAAEVLREKAAQAPTPINLPESGKKLRGRPPGSTKPDSEQAVAEYIGVPRQTINDAKQHVAAVDAFPELAHHSKTDAIKIASSYRALPPEQLEEKRAAVMVHNGQVLAELTGRPPLPSGPSPHERTAKDPAVRFQNDLHDLWKRLNGVRDYGGIGVVVANWTIERKVNLLGEVERISEIMAEWEKAIKESMS